MEFINCPVCGGNKVTVIERGEAERDTLTKEIWFTSETGYFCRCMNKSCIHETEEASTYEKAVELWNKGTVYKWETKWLRSHRNIKEEQVSDFY